jgi:DNA-binding response OmpR family regulator
MRILVAEDDEVLAGALAAGLRREGMAIDVALDGDAALEHLAVNRGISSPTPPTSCAHPSPGNAP